MVIALDSGSEGIKNDCGINAEKNKKVFHSFRHTVADHLLQKDVPENQIAMLVGHSIPGITAGGDMVNGFIQRCYMEKFVLQIDFGIDLSHLKNSKYVVKT